MRECADHGVLDGWYSQLTFEDAIDLFGKDADLRARLKSKVGESQEQTHEHVLHKLTTPARGLPRIVDQPPLLFHRPDLKEGVVTTFFKRYRETLPEERRVLFDRFTLADLAMKVVGVGSVGTRCFVALFLAAPDDPLFLQVKEVRRSVLEEFGGRPRVAHNGQRVVVGQRLMQTASDIFLGWAGGIAGREGYVRQLRDMKVSAELETHTPRVMRAYAQLCGLALSVRTTRLATRR